MKQTHMLELILITSSVFILIFLLLLIIFFFYRKKLPKTEQADLEKAEQKQREEARTEDLVTFQGGQDLTIFDILDAPGEVIGKSDYGTLYKAFLQRNSTLRLLRFLRPVCTSKDKDFEDLVRLIGCVRHPNLVPLLGFYAGSRGEKLLVHPFYGRGNLAEFIRDGGNDSKRWAIILKISMGIAKGLDNLHTGYNKPLVHGNLKSKNVLLDRNYQPCVSDFGLHLLLNPTTGQEMLEASAMDGYKAPELIKMRDVSEESDVYSYGVILLELLSGKEAVNENPTSDEDFYLPNFMRNAVLGHRITDLFHPDILLMSNRCSSNSSEEGLLSEETILKLFQLAMACCSPSPSLRPSFKQVTWKLEEIGK